MEWWWLITLTTALITKIDKWRYELCDKRSYATCLKQSTTFDKVEPESTSAVDFVMMWMIIPFVSLRKFNIS